MQNVDFAEIASKLFETEKDKHNCVGFYTYFIALNEYGDAIGYNFRSGLGGDRELVIPENTYWYVLIYNSTVPVLYDNNEHKHMLRNFYELVIINKDGVVSSWIYDQKHRFEWSIIITTGIEVSTVSTDSVDRYVLCPSKMVLRMDNEWLYSTDGLWPKILSDIWKIYLRCSKECHTKQEARLLCELIKQQQTNEKIYQLLLKNEKSFFPELISVNSINVFGKEWHRYSWDDFDAQRVAHCINLFVESEKAVMTTQLTIHWSDWVTTLNYEWEVDCSQVLSIRKEFNGYLQLINALKEIANRVPLKIEGAFPFFVNGSYYVNLQLPPKTQGEERMNLIGELLGTHVEKTAVEEKKIESSMHSL